ncbi:helix-turn-helix domain-containing protein [uncultured Sphingomonas sp.]|uniref:helix-turn-helix domain-containing protein n=1 Tax=uncultured Sphingomonas sp. TaxID=158754 RepID=UPI0035CBBD94
MVRSIVTITTIREVRRAKGLTLEQVAAACLPPTTPQTIGRLECGTRTVSLPWLRRIASALDVAPADLVRLPARADLPVAALLDGDGARAPRRARLVVPPTPAPGLVAVIATTGVGAHFAGDEIWCEMLSPARFAAALSRDVLVPRPVGRFLFGRLIAREDGPDGSTRLLVLPPGHGARQQVVIDPPWIACAVRLVRTLS